MNLQLMILMSNKEHSSKMPLSPRTIIALVLLCVAVFFLLYERNDSSDSQNAKVYRTTQGMVFGTTYHITYAAAADLDMDSVVSAATDAVNSSLSMFNPESTISKVNSGELTAVNDTLFLNVWRTGVTVSEATDGAFDMTVAPLVDLWGFGLKNRRTVTPTQVDSAMQCVGYKSVTERNGVMEKATPCTRIDAGAIAKGFACDVVRDALIANGCTDVCVEIGGEVSVKGFNGKGLPWHIGVNKPVEDSLAVESEVYAVALLSDRGMATSGNYRNYYELGGQKFSHTINPHTGYPVRHNLLSATIVAPDCMTADAWATACMVVGLDSAKVLVSNHDNLDAYLIYDSLGMMKVWHTGTFPLLNK